MNTKLVIVYTVAPEGSPRWKRAESVEHARLYLELQIEQSLRMGWRRDEVVIVTNFDQIPQAKIGGYYNLGTAAFRGHAGGCLSKHMGAAWALTQFPGCSIWLRDHDCWQLRPLDVAAVLGDASFLVSGGKPPKISDQSCFMAASWLPWLERFIAEHEGLACDKGFGFKLGDWVRRPGVPARVVPYREVNWRFNMVSPRWRKELAAMPGGSPIVCHQRLAVPEMAEFLASQGHWDFLHRYAAASARLKP